MKCSQCKCDKLSKEFPPTMITERCNHITSFCLNCLVDKLELTNTTNKVTRKCPVPGCEEYLSRDEEELLLLAWNNQNIRKVKTPQNTNAVGGNNKTGEIYIVLLNGQRCTLKLNQINNILALRQEIKKELKVDEAKQKLIYDGVELQDRKNDMTPNTLQDYNIGPGSHIQLIVVSYLRFDLFWGYPASGEDYLDGSCLVYKGTECFLKYDRVSQYYPSLPCMKHSGNIIDDANRRGHHCITAKLDQLPVDITQLYFVLSSYKSKNMGRFQNPGFKLVDESQPDKPLCTYQLGQAADSQAVIMCCVSRSRDSQGWNVFQIGKLSEGNVNDYNPIEKSIRECFLFD